MIYKNKEIFFIDTCRKVMDIYLYSNGFKIHNFTATEVIYYRNNIFLEMSYEPFDCPDYCIIGIGYKKEVEKIQYYPSVGIWYLLPSDFGEYNWNFSDEISLEAGLVRVRDEMIDKYIKPLWENQYCLMQKIDKYWEERSARDKEEEIRRKRLRARDEYKKGNYKIAIELFEEMGIENLLQVDEKMYQISLKRHATR